MRPQRRRSWPHAAGAGKPALARRGSLALLVLLVGAAGAAAQELDPAETAWRALVRDGAVPAGAAEDPGSARARWLADSALRELEESAPEQAMQRYRGQLDGAAAAGDSLGVLVSLERLAKLEIEAFQVDEAQAHLERCRRLSEELDQPMARCLADLNLGRALIRTRDVEAAAERLEAARTSATDLGLDRWRGDAALALSVVARLRMDLDTALRQREEAYAAYTAAGYLPGRARAQHFIGTIHAMQGDLTRAMIQLQAAEELARAAGADEVLSGCLGDQAGILFLTGDFAGATARYQEASALTDDPRRKGWYLTNLASIQADGGHYAEAIPSYEQALELVRASGDRRTESTILLAIGQSRCAVGEVDQGLADLDAAIAHAREYQLPADEAKALEVKGHALIDEDRLAAARPLLEDAVARADTLGYWDLQASGRKGLAEIARREGRLDEAEAELQRAVDTILQVRRRSGGSASVQSGYFGEANNAFDALVAVLYERQVEDPDGGHGARAWEVAQRGRARWLLDLLAEAEVDLRVRADQTYREREAEILDAMAALDERLLAAPDSAAVLDPRIHRLESRLTVLEAELRAADPRYADLRYPQPIGLDELRDAVLDAGEAILEFQLGERHSHCWLISHDRFVMRRLPPQAEIEQRVRELLPLLHDPGLTGAEAGWYAGPARAVARDLLDPVLAELAGVERLIVVPDGLLHYLPLDALLRHDSAATEFHELPWLAGAVDVVEAPSVSALARLRRAPPLPTTRPLLLLADPVLPPPQEASVFARVAGAAGLAPVPGAAAETDRLLAVYGDQASVWRGTQATAAHLGPAPDGGAWRSVHLITHGLFNEERPQYSGLVLAPTATDDGFLDVAEIFGLDLECEQVVLSACSSALGESVDGEGLVGLSQAFLYAGARSVVAALWDVGGEGAARFMGRFHERLVTDSGRSRAGALAATRRSLATDPGRTAGGVPLAHPSLWSAFVCIGDGR